MTDAAPTGEVYDIRTFADLLRIPYPARQRFLKDLPQLIADADHAIDTGQLVLDNLHSVTWIDDASPYSTTVDGALIV